MRSRVALLAVVAVTTIDSLRLLAPPTRRHSDPRLLLEHPMEPTPELGPVQACTAVCEGLQKNDEPALDSGILRLYNWMTGPGRVSVAPPPPKSGLQGKVTLDYFVAEAAAPAIGALIDCTRFELVGEPTISPGSQTRGQIATQTVDVYNLQSSDPEVAALTAMIDAPDSYLESVLAAHREGRAPPPAPVLVGEGGKIPPRSRFLFKFVQERRPPNAGCWLLEEMFHMKKTKLQEFNDGGEEFEGEDTG